MTPVRVQSKSSEHSVEYDVLTFRVNHNIIICYRCFVFTNIHLLLILQTVRKLDKYSAMSFIDDVWQQIKRVQTGFDSWVSKNVSRESQNVIIIFVVLMMVLHLVYTKRKLTREYKAEQEKAKKKDQ